MKTKEYKFWFADLGILYMLTAEDGRAFKVL